MSDEWVKFHAALADGSKRSIKRATRFIFMELSLRARKKKGKVDLRHDLPLADAVHDLLGGGSRERREVTEAMPALTSAAPGDDPMILVSEGPGFRQIVIPSWEAYNRVDDSSERVRQHRENKKKEAVQGVAETKTRSVGNGDVTRYQKDVTRYSNGCNGDVTAQEEIREEKKRDPLHAEDLHAGARTSDVGRLKQPAESEAPGAAPAPHGGKSKSEKGADVVAFLDALGAEGRDLLQVQSEHDLAAWVGGKLASYEPPLPAGVCPAPLVRFAVDEVRREVTVTPGLPRRKRLEAFERRLNFKVADDRDDAWRFCKSGGREGKLAIKPRQPAPMGRAGVPTSHADSVGVLDALEAEVASKRAKTPPRTKADEDAPHGSLAFASIVKRESDAA